METKYKFNIDRLEVTYICPQETREIFANIGDKFICGMNDDVLLERCENLTYHHNFAVYCSDLYVGQLFFDSPNPNRPYVYLAVDNRILYECVAGLSYIEQALHLSYYRISKLDVCFDTNRNIINRFYKLLKDESQTIIINNKAIRDRYAVIDNLLHLSTGSLKNIRRVKSFSIEGNEIELFGYDKREELTKSGKGYIKENLQMGKKFYRLEVRFSNHKQIQKALDMCGVDITELYYCPSDDLLEPIFVNTLNRIIRLKDRKCILNYLLQK